jgi:hypothetical protein
MTLPHWPKESVDVRWNFPGFTLRPQRKTSELRATSSQWLASPQGAEIFVGYFAKSVRLTEHARDPTPISTSSILLARTLPFKGLQWQPKIVQVKLRRLYFQKSFTSILTTDICGCYFYHIPLIRVRKSTNGQIDRREDPVDQSYFCYCGNPLSSVVVL